MAYMIFFYTFNIVPGGGGGGGGNSSMQIEEHSAKYWVFQVILTVTVYRFLCGRD